MDTKLKHYKYNMLLDNTILLNSKPGNWFELSRYCTYNLKPIVFLTEEFVLWKLDENKIKKPISFVKTFETPEKILILYLGNEIYKKSTKFGKSKEIFFKFLYGKEIFYISEYSFDKNSIKLINLDVYTG